MRRLLYYVTIVLVVFVLPASVWAEPIETLVDERARESYGVQLPDQARFKIALKDGTPEEAESFSDYWMDKITGRFLANAILPDGSVKRIEGRAVAVMDVPVPTRRLLPGEIITAADLQQSTLPLGRIGAFTVTQTDAVQGMQVKRLLAQGRPVQTQSIIPPVIVDRGERVSIRYEDGQLALSAPGRALSEGHRGQEIRVVNLASNTSVTAVAVAKGIVRVIR
ncbi:flagellar basal body P-ring formation chaperone FlgA [Pseudooceanicola sp. C21-150M6]|uniref:flagellar basal body P-ring formation chaperone FlgA n=1 Tax=Pseudooceanicola sp. C21-150M6 TaxID=3434355 RepID=UPI003D7F2D1E